jgi:hypothetical protein
MKIFIQIDYELFDGDLGTLKAGLQFSLRVKHVEEVFHR